jgi:hypothetical protein
MLVALILICSLASVPDLAACTRDNAVEVMYVPDRFANPVACFIRPIESRHFRGQRTLNSLPFFSASSAGLLRTQVA